MTSDDLSTVHLKFCSSTAIADINLDNEDVGRRVFLEETVQSLRNDPRTKTLQDQLNDYCDPKVSGLNLIGANHQLEVMMSSRSYRYFFILVLLFIGFYQLYWSVISLVHLNILAETISITTYGVQLSTNGTMWSPVVCNDQNGGPCIFDSSILASRPDDVVTNIFPQQTEARYLKILAGTWQEIYNGKKPDMRLDIIGDLGQEGTLRYQVLSDGVSGQAWLQPGCVHSIDIVSPDGTFPAKDNLPRWASIDESLGEVQCCLDSPGVHVCTRDGCVVKQREYGERKSPKSCVIQS